MQSASSARTASETTTGSLDYIDTLVSGATAQGLFQIVVDGKYLNTSMIVSLRALGYTVEVKYDTMGTFPTYYIKW